MEPVLGLDQSQPSIDAPLGSTPRSENFIMREGALEVRRGLAARGTNANSMRTTVTGGWEINDVFGNRYPLISGTSRLAWFSNGSWSAASYVSAYGLNDPPAGSATSYWDATQTYAVDRDDMIAVLANGSYQSLYCWQSNTTIFSTLTGAPQAKFVMAFDNYVLAANVRSGSSEYVQRIMWNDRGSSSSWTGGLAGFEDLLSMRGAITRLTDLDNRIIVFSDQEIWQGYPSAFPNVFRFEQLDHTVGCPYSWTVADTPLGLIFLARNLQTYLLPKGGGPPRPIGQRLHREIRNSIDIPERAWSLYDSALDQFQLYYPHLGGSGFPQRAVFLNLADGSWAPQTFAPVTGNISLTRGFAVTGLALTSSATTWGGLSNASLRWADLTQSWAQMNAGTTSQDARLVFVGTSAGTMTYPDSTATNDLGVTFPARWRSTGLWGEIPDRTKTVTEWRADYQAESSSSLTVRFSQTLGAGFDPGVSVGMQPASIVSQALAFPYLNARYPLFEVESEGQKYRLFRFYVSARIGGQ